MLPGKGMPCFPIFEDNQGAVQLSHGKMLLDCMAISITPCLMGYYIASGFVFLVYLHDD